MNFVEPIRDPQKIDSIKSILVARKNGQRNVLIFTLGINTAYRISDLCQLKLSNVFILSRQKVIAKKRIEMRKLKIKKELCYSNQQNKKTTHGLCD